MKNMASVILKPGRDKAIRNRHHWIFSGAVREWPDFKNGDILPVRSANGEMLGHAYFNRKSSIAGRMISFGDTAPEDAIRQNVENALELRRRFYNPAVTNAVRLINAEGDSIPGLIADLYNDVLVIQAGTLGMEKLKPLLLELLVKNLKPRCVYEKSDPASRHEEGLADFEGTLYGEPVGQIRILEHGLAFLVNITGSQKTGFYLDQREMRKLAGEQSADRHVLNAFAYTGAFSVYALKGGAKQVDSLETSESALSLAKENFKLNGLTADAASFITADVFEYLRRPELDYDFIILDPPAFAKKRPDIVQACRGYKDINRLAIQKVQPQGLVMTFSCSRYVDEKLFRQVVFQAAYEAERQVRILQRYRQPFDHPINVFHPETEYLKGFLLYVD
jgi:23S rRNA (cytosine1962-C5)-methyltransferase